MGRATVGRRAPFPDAKGAVGNRWEAGKDMIKEIGIGATQRAEYRNFIKLAKYWMKLNGA